MKIAIVTLVVVSAVLAYAEPQLYYPSYGLPWQQYQQQFLRTSQLDLQQEFAQGRLFFATQTITLATTTVTTTSTSTTTCTTSTAALSACSPSGRRRRRAMQGLLYDEEDSIFLPAASKAERSPEAVPELPQQGPVTYVPYIIQPGFEYLTNNRDARFLVAFTTATKTVTSTTTTINSLVAVCSSTTTFQLCGSNGK